MRTLMKGAGLLVALVVLLNISAEAGREKTHYEFVLPANYIGWICVGFNDTRAQDQQGRGRSYLIPIAEDGTYNTSSVRVLVLHPMDTFFYKSIGPEGVAHLSPVPSSFILEGTDHGGFSVRGAHGGLWFLFIGPAELRAKVRFADWNAEVEDRIKKYGTGDLGPPEPLPVPGRLIPSKVVN